MTALATRMAEDTVPPWLAQQRALIGNGQRDGRLSFPQYAGMAVCRRGVRGGRQANESWQRTDYQGQGAETKVLPMERCREAAKDVALPQDGWAGLSSPARDDALGIEAERSGGGASETLTPLPSFFTSTSPPRHHHHRRAPYHPPGPHHQCLAIDGHFQQ